MEEADIKFWKDAGHVARRTIEGIKGEIVAGKSWDDLIDSAERGSSEDMEERLLSQSRYLSMTLPPTTPRIQFSQSLKAWKKKWCSRKEI